MTQEIDEVRYCRLCLLTQGECPRILQRVIDNSYSHTVSNFETFLNQNIHAIFHLRFRNCCCRPVRSNATPMTKTQWDLLFTPISIKNPHGSKGNCPCQYRAIAGITSDVLDVTLCCLFLKNICQNIPQTDVDTIRQVRNALSHTSTATVDEPTFNAHWSNVEQALLNLTILVSPAFENETQTQLQNLKGQSYRSCRTRGNKDDDSGCQTGSILYY